MVIGGTAGTFLKMEALVVVRRETVRLDGIRRTGISALVFAQLSLLNAADRLRRAWESNRASRALGGHYAVDHVELLLSSFMVNSEPTELSHHAQSPSIGVNGAP